MRQAAVVIALAITPLAAQAGSATIQVLEPAVVDAPDHIQTIGLVDRSAPRNAGQGALSSLEGLVTGEGIRADRDGAKKALEALAQVLRDSPRFEVVLINADRRTLGSSVWDRPLDARTARSLCRRKCDAIISLEAFDSDSNTAEIVDNAAKGDVVGVSVEREVALTTSWRFYDARSGSIVDAQRDLRVGGFWSAKGDSFDEAVAGLPDGRSIVAGLAMQAGEDYAVRVAPTWMEEQRRIIGGNIFTGDRRLRHANALARRGDWESAAAAYRRAAKSGDAKVRGKALYNLSVAQEAMGDLDGAVDTARQAMQTLGDRKSRNRVAEVVRQRDRSGVAYDQLAMR